MTQLKTLRLNLPAWWLPPILSTVSSTKLQRVLLAVDLRTDEYHKAYEPFSPSQVDWIRCDEILTNISHRSRKDPSIPRVPMVIMLAILKPVPLMSDPSECARVFDLFERLRADDHYIGLRSYSGFDNMIEEVWYDGKMPCISFAKDGPVDRAGF